jgi:hypothetical protein
MIHGNANTIENSEAFDAIVGALREWYVMDRESYGGENIIKIKDEVDNYLP